MSDEYDDIEFQAANVEYEIERQKWNLDGDPNQSATRSKLGCLGLVIKLVIGLFLFKAILEVISFFS